MYKNFPIYLYAINFGNRSPKYYLAGLFFQHERQQYKAELWWPPIRKMAILADTIINESLNLLADSSAVWILNGFQRFHALVVHSWCIENS